MKHILTLITALLFAPLSVLPAADGPMKKPNIIVILADDLGYECIGANGGKSYQTPNLDRLRARVCASSNAMRSRIAPRRACR